ncbi:hypothetical protein AB0B10_25930 [Micromonospora arborensis]|uniref:hypothetical protein n=1 Tax=Micromonospora arborensis TaxID=2116518 RepID=UPI0033C51D50
MTTFTPEVRARFTAALAKKAEIEALERRARELRAELDADLAAIVGSGVAKRAVAREMQYRSDNSVRAKTARHGSQEENR